MSLNVGQLTAILDLDSKPFDSKLDQAGTKTGGMSNKAKAGLAAVGIAVTEFGRRSVVAFADFETGMNEVWTLLPNHSKAAMDQMSGQVLDFAGEFAVLPDQVVPALYQSLSAGVPPGNVFEFLETAQKAARGGVTDLTTAVDGITSVVNAYGSDVVNATQASDQMFTAVRLGKTNFEELSASLFNVIPTAAGLGVGFGDVTAALAAMTAQGTPTSVATTQMRQMLVELSKEGSATADTFEGLAGKSFREFIAGGGNVEGALQLMATEAAKSGGSISDMFGSVEAGSAALSLTSEQGAEAFGNALDEMSNSAGATDAAYEKMATGLGFQFEKIKAAAAVTMVRVGEWLGPKVAAAIRIGQQAMQGLRNWWTTNGPAITAKIGEVVTWIQTNVGPVIEDVMAGVQESFADVQAWVDQHWPEIQEAITHVVNVIQEVIERNVEAIRQAWQMFGDDILRIARTMWSYVSETVQNGVRMVQAIIETVLAVINGDWGKAWDGIKAYFAAVWDQMGNILSTAWGLIQGILGVAAETISTVWEDLWLKVKGILSGAWDSMKSTVSSSISTVVGWLGGLPGRARDALGNVAGTLVGKGSDLISGLLTGARNMFGAVKTWFALLPTNILAALGNLGSMLWNAGRAIIGGLINGITSKFGAVRDTLTTLGGLIPDWKGPPAHDRRILFGAGQLIIDGLGRGMRSEWRNIESLLGHFTDNLRMSDLAGVGLAGGVSLAGVGGDSPALIEELRMLRAEVAGMRPVEVHVDGLTDRTAAALGARAGAELSMRGGF